MPTQRAANVQVNGNGLNRETPKGPIYKDLKAGQWFMFAKASKHYSGDARVRSQVKMGHVCPVTGTRYTQKDANSPVKLLKDVAINWN